MHKASEYSIEYIKSLGKEKSEKNFDLLLSLFQENLPVDVKREVVSSIGRQNDLDRIIKFLNDEAFNNHPMELVYQMFRTCLYKRDKDSRFEELGKKIILFYDNEVIDKMFEYKSRGHKKRNIQNKNYVKRPILLIGDAEFTLSVLPEQCIQLMFTSPPYYNAKEYSDYHSYNEYLNKMKKVFESCNRVLEDGRFLIVNVSPVISKRPGREFESIRYPIHYDFHKILVEAGFYFVDEIQWIKPEPSVPNRNGGYMQTRKALSYKPNCINESIMVYRKKCDFLLDVNIGDYTQYNRYENEEIDTSNCWFIAPSNDKNHPAVFPEELCRRILKYYSFEGDTVLDPFAGSGTLGRVAIKMNRIPVMCELNEEYAKLIRERGDDAYDVRECSNCKYS